MWAVLVLAALPGEALNRRYEPCSLQALADLGNDPVLRHRVTISAMNGDKGGGAQRGKRARYCDSSEVLVDLAHDVELAGGAQFFVVVR